MVDVEPAFVTDCEAAKLVEPCEGALDDPAVAAEFLPRLDASARDAGPHAAPVARVSAAAVVVSFVGVQLVRPAARSTALTRDGRDGIDQVFERHAVVDIGASEQKGERDPATVGDQMTLCAGPASVGRVRASCGTPFLAAMDELSTQARFQSIRSASCSLRNNSRCNRSHTPQACQSRSRRQQVTPDPHPISAGSISHGMPVRRTKRMPVSPARAGIGGRPP